MVIREAAVARRTGTWALGSGLDGVRHVLCVPGRRRGLWSQYVDGVSSAYNRHGVLAALDLRADVPHAGHPWVAVSLDGDRVVAGLRINGPLRMVDDAAAVREFAVDPVAGERVRRILAATLPDGVAEIKGFWVRHDHADRHDIAAGLAGSAREIASLIGVRHLLCTAADHAAGRWIGAGGLPLTCIPQVPYPDDRYRTGMLWWDHDHPGRTPDQSGAVSPAGDRHRLVPPPRGVRAHPPVRRRSGRSTAAGLTGMVA